MPRWNQGVRDQTPELFKCEFCGNPFDDSTRKPFVCKADCRQWVVCEECWKEHSYGLCECEKCKTAPPNFEHYTEFSEYMNSALTNEERTDQQFECQNCSLPFNDSDRKAFVCKLECRKDICCEMCKKLVPKSWCTSCKTPFGDYVPYKEFQDKVREHREETRTIRFKEHQRILEKSNNERKDAEKQLLEYKDEMENIVKKLEEENEEWKKIIEDLEKAKKDFQRQLATAEEVNGNLEQKLEKEKNEKMEAEKKQIAYKEEMENIVRKLEEERNRLSDALLQREKLESEYVRETGRGEELLSISKAANRFHDESEGRSTTCAVCPDENNQDRLIICFECARNAGVDVEVSVQEQMRPFFMCSMCALIDHKSHDFGRYLPWKIKEVLRNSERKGAEIVTKMDEMCAQESRNAKESLDSWLQVVARVREKDGISFEDACELSSEIKENALIIFDSRRNNFADICRFTKAVKDSTERLLSSLPREDGSSIAEERLETVD